MRKRKGRNSGFSLIELIVALAILAILTAIAVPSYQGALRKARRAEGRTYLHTLMMAEERYYANFNRYAPNGTKDLGQPDASQPGGYYLLSRFELGAGAQFVRITVAPRGPQVADTCGDLTLDSTGFFQASGGTVDECR